MIVSTKHGDIKIKINHEAVDNSFVLRAVNKDDILMGKLVFCVERELNRCSLSRITTEELFEGQGVGSALITAMEYISLRQFRISNIVGVFSPIINQKQKKSAIKEKERYIKDFYHKNNFNIDKYSTLSKSLDKTLKEYSNIIDISYEELQSLKIDFDALEEQQYK